jgi:Fic-DOC domain mobile mystery protein B
MDASTLLTPEESDGLKPNLATRHELNEWENKNIGDALDWAMHRLQLDPFAESYVRELHKRMFDQTWKWAGKYRKSDKNLGIPHQQILERIGALLGNARYWVENKTYNLDESAVRLHHEAVVIHPFPDGNGRHARLWADVVVSKFGHEAFSWGFGATNSGYGNLAEAGAIRNAYVTALQAADKGDISELLKFARS